MNLSNNLLWREGGGTESFVSKALAVSPRLQKLKPAFSVSHSTKSFSSFYKILVLKKKRKKVQKKSSGGMLTVVSAYSQLKTIVSVKHATRAPKLCHPSETKSEVTVLLNPSFSAPYPHTNTYAHTPPYTHIKDLTKKNPHLTEPSRHRALFVLVTQGKVTWGLSQTAKETRRVMESENGAPSSLCSLLMQPVPPSHFSIFLTIQD